MEIKQVDEIEFKDCRTCFFCLNKETSKTNKAYGSCAATSLLLLAVQLKCFFFKNKGSEENG